MLPTALVAPFAYSYTTDALSLGGFRATLGDNDFSLALLFLSSGGLSPPS